MATMVSTRSKRRNDGSTSVSKKNKNETPKFDEKSVSELMKLVRKFENLGSCESGKILSSIKVSIGFAGETSSGKSTLINAVMATNAMPMGELACTGFNVRVTTVEPGEIPCKYRLFLPNEEQKQVASVPTPAPGVFEVLGSWMKRETSQTTTKEEPKHHLDSNEPAVIVEKLVENFKPFLDAGLDHFRYADLVVSQENAPKIVLVDTPGPRLSGTSQKPQDDWEKSIASLDGSNHPIIVVPVRCDVPDICSNGPLLRIVNQRSGLLKDVRLIIAFTHIDKMWEKPEAPAKLMNAMQVINNNLGSMIHRYAVVQCIDQKAAPNDFAKHRETERTTISKIPSEVLNYTTVGLNHSPLIKGVDELRNTLFQLYLSRWSEEGLQKFGAALSNEIAIKQDLYKKRSAHTRPQEIAGNVYTTAKPTPTSVAKLEDVYTSSVLDKLRLCLESVELDKEQPLPRLFYIFGPTKEQKDFKNQEDMRKAIGTILDTLAGHAGDIVDNMVQHHKEHIESLFVQSKETCPQLFDVITETWHEFISKKRERLVKRTAKSFSKTKDVLMICSQEKVDYPISFAPNGHLAKAGPIAQNMLRELKFNMNHIHWEVTKEFISSVCSTFPRELNARLCRIQEVWYAASQDEIEQTARELTTLMGAWDNFQEITRIYESSKE